MQNEACRRRNEARGAPFFFDTFSRQLVDVRFLVGLLTLQRMPLPQGANQQTVYLREVSLADPGANLGGW